MKKLSEHPMQFLNYAAIRSARKEGGAYAAATKIQPTPVAEALRISCNGLRHEAIRARVAYCLTQALYNADDTLVDGYDAHNQRAFPELSAFWGMIFRTSLQDVASREDKRVARFFTSRGVHV